MTAYQFDFEDAQVGQIADSSIHRIDSYSAYANIQFGTAVNLNTGATFGDTPRVNRLITEVDEVFGISVFTPTLIDGYYKIDEIVSVLTFGRIYVISSDLVLAGSRAFLRVSNNTFVTTPTTGSENNIRVGRFLLDANIGDITVLDFSPWRNNL